MELKEGKRELDLGGEAHAEGDYVFQVNDGGVEFTKADDSKKQTYVVRSSSTKVIDGQTDALGGTMVDFITVITKDGSPNKTAEAQIISLLTINNLIGKFAERFGGNIDPTDEKFVNALKLKLPGCTFAGRVKHREWNQRVNANFTKIWDPQQKPTGKGAATQVQTKLPNEPADNPATETAASSEDW